MFYEEERCLKRGKRELILRLIFECRTTTKKTTKRNISENIFAPQSLNTRSSRSVLITIQRRVVSRGARD